MTVTELADTSDPRFTDDQRATLADTVLALADDYMTEHPDGIDTDEVYDWLVAQAAEIRKGATR